MQITVRLFAKAKELAGTDSMTLQVPDQSTVRVAKSTLVEHCPALSALLPVLLVAVDGRYANDNTLLKQSCELACFPPVSGG